MGKTIQDELQEVSYWIGLSIACRACPHWNLDCAKADCREGVVNGLLAALDARGLEIVRKGEK